MKPEIDPLEAQREAALAKAVETLGEYYDSVRVFVSTRDEATTLGSGSFFAQYGQVALWLQNVVEQEEAEDDGE